MKTTHLVYLLLLSIFSLLCALTLTPPLLFKAGHPTAAELSYVTFSGVCHQLPERSLHLFGRKLAVCARCTGVYFGMLLATLAYPAARGLENRKTPPGWIIAAALTPLALDGLTQLAGLRESTNPVRLATGLVFGAAVPFYLIPLFIGVAEVFGGRVFKKGRG